MKKVLKYIIYYLIKAVRKKANRWVFGAWRGELYADNAKYLFEYINKEYPNIETIWITRNPKVLEEIQKKGYRVYLKNSFYGFWYSITAKIAIVTEGTHDIGGMQIAGAKVIQLWHGMGIKDVVPKRNKNISELDELLHAHKYEYWMTACEEASSKYSKAFDVPKEQMYITGQPKDDTFVNSEKNEIVDYIREKHEDCKIVVYLPTHRKFGVHKQDDTLCYETLVKVNERLEKRNIVMIFKPHAHEFKNYEGLDINMSNIIFATDIRSFGDVYEFLPACDGMITDYSGIMLGYLTSGKPMFYFPYDYEEYMSEDFGICYDYMEVTAGPICKTWDELINAMEKTFACDTYKNKREQLRLRFSPYNDGRNCERVFAKIDEIAKC